MRFLLPARASRARAGRLARALTVAAVLLARLPSSAAADPQSSDGTPPAVAPELAGFEFTQQAKDDLHSLWRLSTIAKQERVACLGGHIENGTWEITVVEPLSTVAGDSMNVSAATSLAECGPPRWLGTVHTHVAMRQDETPYATFSGADRGVMDLWSRRWGMHGVFCVVYSDRDAHCEESGGVIAGPETRATY